MREIREATIADIPAMHGIRLAVTENRLSDPAKVTPQDYSDFVVSRGRGWVCLVNASIRGFVFLDNADGNVWALFVEPDYEGQGIGRLLHDTMLHWAEAHGHTHLWLTTAPGTRAERFYRRAGWRLAGDSPGELRFEFTFPLTPGHR